MHSAATSRRQPVEPRWRARTPHRRARDPSRASSTVLPRFRAHRRAGSGDGSRRRHASRSAHTCTSSHGGPEAIVRMRTEPLIAPSRMCMKRLPMKKLYVSCASVAWACCCWWHRCVRPDRAATRRGAGVAGQLGSDRLDRPGSVVAGDVGSSPPPRSRISRPERDSSGRSTSPTRPCNWPIPMPRRYNFLAQGPGPCSRRAGWSDSLGHLPLRGRSGRPRRPRDPNPQRSGVSSSRSTALHRQHNSNGRYGRPLQRVLAGGSSATLNGITFLATSSRMRASPSETAPT